MTDKQFEQIECLSKKLWEDINNGHEYSMVTYSEFLGIVTEVWERLQEEPVSVWNDSNKEQPNFASTVAIWNPKYKNGEIVSRCTEVYPDRIWAYIDELLKM